LPAIFTGICIAFYALHAKQCVSRNSTEIIEESIMTTQKYRKCSLISTLCLALTFITSASAFAESTRLYSNTRQAEMKRGSLTVERDSDGILHFSGVDSATGQSCDHSFDLDPNLVDATVKERLANLVLVGNCSTLALMAQDAKEAEIEKSRSAGVTDSRSQKASKSYSNGSDSENSGTVSAGIRALSIK
jgi:hypothetical protein